MVKAKIPPHPDEAKKFMMETMQNVEAAQARFEAGRKFLEAHESTDAQQTAAIGYCFGGGVVLHMARQGADLKGVASFHGSLATETPAQPGQVKAKILVQNGADDPFVPVEQREAFKKEMNEAGADYEFIDYPGAVHAFTSKEADENGKKFELPLAYHADADAKSWAKMRTFFDEIFAD